MLERPGGRQTFVPQCPSPSPLLFIDIPASFPQILECGPPLDGLPPVALIPHRGIGILALPQTSLPRLAGSALWPHPTSQLCSRVFHSGLLFSWTFPLRSFEFLSTARHLTGCQLSGRSRIAGSAFCRFRNPADPALRGQRYDRTRHPSFVPELPTAVFCFHRHSRFVPTKKNSFPLATHLQQFMIDRMRLPTNHFPRSRRLLPARTGAGAEAAVVLAGVPHRTHTLPV
jgi:hypothetical protein